MHKKFLIIKPAFIADEIERTNISNDILSLSSCLVRLFEDKIGEYEKTLNIDIYNLTEDGEYLMHGRSQKFEYNFKNYDKIFSFVKFDNFVYKWVFADLKKYAEKYTFVYDEERDRKHDAYMLSEAIQKNKLKIKTPHARHIDIKEHNSNYISTEDIVKKHFRDLFLPIEIIDTKHAKYKTHHDTNHAYNALEFYEHIEKRRLISDYLTAREAIKGHVLYIAVLPDIREQKHYITSTYSLHNYKPTFIEKEGIKHVLNTLSEHIFKNESVVYKIVLHNKRGIFIQNTSNLLTYMIWYTDIFYELIDGFSIKGEEILNII